MSHHYVQYESLNRYVFSRLLNPVTVLDDRMSTGRLFRAFGRATAKAQLPNLTRVLGTRRLPRATERSDRRVDMVVTGMHHPTSLTCHVSDVGWCETVCGLVHQQTQLEPECYSLVKFFRHFWFQTSTATNHVICRYLCGLGLIEWAHLLYVQCQCCHWFGLYRSRRAIERAQSISWPNDKK